MIRLYASLSPGEMRVAAWDGARLHDVAIWRDAASDGMHDVHRGRVIARVPAMAGCFVALEGGVEGFLPDSEGAADAGRVLGVRVTRAAQGGKGPRLSARLSEADQALIGSGAPALIRRGPDALARMQAAFPEAPVTRADNAFPPELEDAWEALSNPTADLPGGARMHIHPTPALTAIDIDLGAATAERAGKARSQAQANRALLPELARQIRLRNLSGAILVDLGGMAAKKRADLAPDFVAALASDSLKPRFLGFTQLGLAEIVRPRVHPALHELLATPHAHGLAALRQLVREADATPYRTLVLHASAEIADMLRRDSAARDGVFARTGRDLTIIDHRDWPPGRSRIEEAPRG